MISQLALEDLNDLRAEGLQPTDEDIVRLHALGSRLTNGKDTTAASTPRFAFAGGYVFHEPTMAARFWYAYAKSFADDTATEDWLFAFACAHGREPGYLDKLQSPADIERALGEFLGAFHGTKAELERAVAYAAIGPDYVEAEQTELAKKRAEKENAELTPSAQEQKNYAALEDLLGRAAAATGFSFADLMAQTPSRLSRMIYAAHVQAGMQLTADTARAHADYMATLTAIAERLRAEKAAAEEAKP